MVQIINNQSKGNGTHMKIIPTPLKTELKNGTAALEDITTVAIEDGIF